MIRKDKTILSLVIAAITVSLIFFLPDIIGYTKSDAKNLYSGNSYAWDPWDVNVYVSVIRYSQTYGFRYQNLYTTEKMQNSVIVYPFYSLEGLLLKNLNPFIIYNLSSFAVTFVLFFSIYITSLYILKNKWLALLTSILSCFAGGFGWLAIFLDIPSADTSITPFIMENVLQRPHSSLALSLYSLSLGLIYKSYKNNNKFISLSSLFCIILASTIYPYLLLSFMLVVSAFTILRTIKDKNKNFLYKNFILLLGLLIFGLIYSFHFLKASGLNGVIRPNLKTPGFYPLLLGIGFFTIPLLLGLKRFRSSVKFQFLYIWLFVHIVLSYSLMGFGRYYFLGIFIPISLISVLLIRDYSTKIKLLYIFLIFIPTSITSVVILFSRIDNVLNKNSGSYWRVTDIEAIKYIKTNFQPGENVLSTYPFSNFIPTFIPVYTYYGHYYQTSDSIQKLTNQLNFFDNKMSEDSALGFLKKEKINYIIWKNENQNWKNAVSFNIPKYQFLKLVYKNNDYLIYTYKD